MSKLKVVVYAICKNEEKFVRRWTQSMKEADEIVVLDTGSTDKTVQTLKDCGVTVYEQVIKPWRFDTARNESLAKVPEDADICVCTDLDEVFVPGWREILEEYWIREQPTRARYDYNWRLDEEGVPRVSFWINKIHARKGYHWHHPVHEVLVSTIDEKEIEVPILLNHYPDESKSRGSYLPLLEVSVVEDPDDDRNLHYLGREYMYYQRWDECIDTLHKHLKCPNATWKDERCASMRFMGRAYQAKGYLDEAQFWFQRAIHEAPYLREGYIELASLCILQNDYEKAYLLLHQALEIKEKSKSYINEEFAWNDYIYDLLSIAAFYTGHYQESVECIRKAMEINPTEARYQSNLDLVLPYSYSV